MNEFSGSASKRWGLAFRILLGRPFLPHVVPSSAPPAIHPSRRGGAPFISTERGCGRLIAVRTADRCRKVSGALVNFSHAAVKLSGRQAGLNTGRRRISLMRQEPGSHAHQDFAKSFGFVAPSGSGVCHAHNMTEPPCPKPPTRIRAKLAENVA